MSEDKPNADASYWDECESVDPPMYLSSSVIHGFQRGSKELGCPTANLEVDKLQSELDSRKNGIYFGWAQLHDKVYQMVMSIGYNPYYNDDESKKTAEVHILHEFPEDFYGEHLKVITAGYIRPELNFNSLQELIDAIQMDIKKAKEWLQDEQFASFETDDYFSLSQNPDEQAKEE